MPLFHLVVLALVQGITEFLPISSSGHLILVPCLTGWTDQGPIIDVAVHVGTLFAVVGYFRRDVAAMVTGGAMLLIGRWSSGGRLALQVVLASVPVMVAGLVIHEVGWTIFRSVGVIAWATIGFGVLLWLADRIAPAHRSLDDLGYGDALVIGLSQALALIPGTSRSGITMTAGRAIGLSRTEAARFSLLLSIPAILGAGTLAAVDIAAAGDASLGQDALVAAGLAFVSAWIAIALMMRWLRHATFTPFVIYRMVLGIALLLLMAVGWDCVLTAPAG